MFINQVLVKLLVSGHYTCKCCKLDEGQDEFQIVSVSSKLQQIHFKPLDVFGSM